MSESSDRSAYPEIRFPGSWFLIVLPIGRPLVAPTAVGRDDPGAPGQLDEGGNCLHKHGLSRSLWGLTMTAGVDGLRSVPTSPVIASSKATRQSICLAVRFSSHCPSGDHRSPLRR